MSLAEKFKIWETQLHSSSEDATKRKCAAEIFETIATVREEKTRITIVWKVLHKICSEVKGAKNFGAYNDVFVKVVPHIRDDGWERFIDYFNYYMQASIIEQRFNDTLAILPVIDQLQLTTEKAIKDYFVINTNYYAAFIIMHELSDARFELCANNVLKSLQIARKLKPECFLLLLNELFAKRHYFRYLLLKNIAGKEKFLRSVTAVLVTLKNVNDIERFTIDTSTHLILLIDIDLESKTIPNLVQPYLKACMGLATAADKKKPSQEMVSAIYFLIKLFGILDSDQFSSNLDHVLGKFEEILEFEKTTPWIVNSAVTLCEILNFLTRKAYEKLNSENIRKIAELMMKLMKILSKADSLVSSFEKTVCVYCCNIGRHEFFNLALVATKIFHRAIDLKLSDKQIGHSFLTTFNYVMGSCIDLKCKQFDTIFYNLCLICCKALMNIKSEFYGNYALKVLEIMKGMKVKPEFLSDMKLIYIYKHILSVLNRPKQELEMNCLYVVLSLNKGSSPKHAIVADIVKCYRQFKEAGYTPDQSISDILDAAVLKFEVPKYDRNKLIRWELEASKHLDDCTFKDALVRKAICHAKNEIELAEIITMLGKITVPDWKGKIKSAIENLTNQIATNKNDIEKKLLALAQLKFRYIFLKLDQAKKLFAGKDITEATLKDIDCNDYKNVNLVAESRVIASLIEARKCYEQYYSHVVLTAGNSDWEQIIDDVSQIARQFNLRGYIVDAYKSWLLIYEITRLSELKLHRIRSISYFAEYSHIIEELEDCIDLKKTIRDISSDLLDSYRQLDSYTPRQQNYVILCIINIALFHWRQKDYRRAELLIELAKKKRSEMVARNKISELISINLMAFDFHMITKSGEARAVISPYAYVHDICDEIRNIKNITSEDSVNVPAFLFRLVTDASHFVINRLCASPMKPHLNSLLKFAAEIGMGFRMAQIISLMTIIDLQTELIENCQVKLVILDTILTNESERKMKKEAEISSLSSCSSSNLLDKKKHLDIVTLYDEFVEPTRKIAPKSPRSPRHFKLPHETSKINVSQYFLTHPKECNCVFCLIPMFRMIAFEVGCLHGRRYYITGDLITSEIFFENAFNWWRTELSMSVNNYLFSDSISRMIVFYLNTLRRLKLYKRAMNVIEIAEEYYKKYPKLIDVAYEQNLAEQMLSIGQFLESSTKPEIKTKTSSSTSNVASGSKSTSEKYTPLLVTTRCHNKPNGTTSTIIKTPSIANTISTRSKRKK